MTIFKKILDFIDKYVLYLLLFLSFLFYFQLTENTIIISAFLWPTIFLSIVDIFYKIYYRKINLNDRLFWIMNFFIISYSISILFNYKLGIYNSIRTLAYLIILFWIVYTYNFKINSTFKFYFILATLISLASLIIIPMKYTVLNILGTSIELEGIAWGRLCGLYTDYNYGGLICVNAILIGIYMIKNTNKNISKVVITLGIIVNILYIYFSDSRGSLLALIVGLFLLMFLFFIIKPIIKKEISGKKILLSFAMIVITISVIVVGKNLIKRGYSNLFEKNIEKSDIVINEEKDISEVSKEISVLNREDGTDKDFSNRRFDLWKSSIEYFRESPIFGVGFENLVEYGRKYLPNTYLINNDFTLFYNFHNAFFNILAAQGIIGIVLFLIILLKTLNVCIIVLKKECTFNNIIMIAIIFANFIEGLNLIGDIIYFLSPNAVVYWLVTGVITKKYIKIKEHKK